MPYSMIDAEKGTTKPRSPPPTITTPQTIVPSPLPPQPGTIPAGYTGTVTEVGAPKGYVITNVETVQVPVLSSGPTSPLSPLPPDPALAKPTGKTALVTEITMEKTPEVLMYAPDPFFGLEVQYPYESAPPELKAIAKRVEIYNPEERATTGLGLATGVAVGIGIPAAGAAGLSVAGAGEAVKLGVTKQHLTVQEAVFLANVGELGYIGVSQLAKSPKVQEAYQNLLNRVQPERAMYEKVVAQANQQLGVPETPPVKAEIGTSFTDKLIGKLSPERAMYNRNVLGALNEEKPTLPMGTSDQFLTGPTQMQRTGFAQQLLYKQASVQKAPMKPFLATLQVPKTVLVPSIVTTTVSALPKVAPQQAVQKIVQNVGVQQKELVRTVQQPAQNPFLHYGGKPYYKQAVREDEAESLFVVYPNSGLAQPVAPKSVSLVQSKVVLTQTPSLIDSQARRLVSGQRQAQSQKQLQRQIQSQIHATLQLPSLVSQQTTKQVAEQKLIQKQVQETSQVTRGIQQAKQQPLRLAPNFPLGGGEAGTRSFARLTGKWTPRKHPVKTWDQMLKTFGVSGKVPKGVQRLSRMEVPKFGGRGKRRRRR